MNIVQIGGNLKNNNMKISEFKQLIKEEIKNILNESISDKIYHLEGTLIINNDRNLQAILSDIRSIPGITVVKNSEAAQSTASKFFRVETNIKIDPYPFLKKNESSPTAIIQDIINQIKGIKGVVGFKQTKEPYSSEI